MHRPIAIAVLLAMLLPAGKLAAASAPARVADPPPVADLTAAASGSDLTLTWTHAGAEVDHYEVHRCAAPHCTLDATSHLADVHPAGQATVQYVDAGGLFAGAISYYAVAPIGPTGERYPASNRVGAFVLELNPTWVHTQSRQAALDFYRDQYLSSENAQAGWTGSHAACDAGTTSAGFKAAVLSRINYYRAMAGVPNLRSLSDAYNEGAQAAALMMSVNRSLSHDPPSTWTCYSAAGAQAAGRSGLCLGCHGPFAISVYIADWGAYNYAVGHRRWILFPPTQQMGTGDVPPCGDYSASNALWVFDVFSPRPMTREPYVAWPPPGYAPYQVVAARWSFSYPGADFASATVTMQSGGAGIAVSLQPVVNGYGENTLVWTPECADGDVWPRPDLDTLYTVTVQDVLVRGQRRDFAYDVVVFDPGGSAGAVAAGARARAELGPAPRWPDDARNRAE